MVYQEQVMQTAQICAGYTLGGADLLRRAMGKKKPEEMVKQRQIFLEGAGQKGIDAAQPNWYSSTIWKSSQAMVLTARRSLCTCCIPYSMVKSPLSCRIYGSSNVIGNAEH